MKKYKLAKDDVLGKTVLAAKGELDNYDIKLHLSLFVSKLILEYGADKLPEDIYLNLSIIFSLGAFAEVIFCITDKKRRDNAKNKLNELKSELKKYKYEVGTLCPTKFHCLKEGTSTILFDNFHVIDYDGKTYWYTDLDSIGEVYGNDELSNLEKLDALAPQDITNLVHKVLLPKRRNKNNM